MSLFPLLPDRLAWHTFHKAPGLSSDPDRSNEHHTNNQFHPLNCNGYGPISSHCYPQAKNYNCFKENVKCNDTSESKQHSRHSTSINKRNTPKQKNDSGISLTDRRKTVKYICLYFRLSSHKTTEIICILL